MYVLYLICRVTRINFFSSFCFFQIVLPIKSHCKFYKDYVWFHVIVLKWYILLALDFLTFFFSPLDPDFSLFYLITCKIIQRVCVSTCYSHFKNYVDIFTYFSNLENLVFAPYAFSYLKNPSILLPYYFEEFKDHHLIQIFCSIKSHVK